MRLLVLLLAFLPLAGAGEDVAVAAAQAVQQGNYAEAARLYGKWIAAGHDSPEMRVNHGIMLQLSGNNGAALEELHRALRGNPDLPGANLFAGLAEFGLGRSAAALPLLERARKLSPSNPAPLLALGKVQMSAGNLSASLSSYREAAALAPQSAEAWFGAGIAARSLATRRLAGRTLASLPPAEREQTKHYLEESFSALSRSVELDPASARTHLLLAESLRDSGKLTDAAEEYTTAIKLEPKMTAAYLGLATGWWKVADYDQALPPLRKVLEMTPNDPSANAMLADILEKREDREGAARAASLALKGDPALPEAHYVLARIYLAKKEPRPAITELSQITAVDPDGSYHYLLYRAYKLTGDETRARTALEEFQRRRKENTDH